MIDLTREDLESRVREAFSDGPPNGWLLGWAEDRGFREFAQVVAPHKAANNTSFDYAFCNHFDVRMALDDAKYAVLTVLTSFVADVFSMHWTLYGPGGRGGQVVNDVPRGRALEATVQDWLAGRGFVSLPDRLGDVVLDGLELELSGEENVTLAKCVFQDFEG